MIDAVAIVLDISREALSVGKCCIVVRLYVRNAINLLDWGWIEGVLIKLVTDYWARLIECYLSKKLQRSFFETDDAQKEYIMKADDPEGPILGVLL